MGGRQREQGRGKDGLNRGGEEAEEGGPGIPQVMDGRAGGVSAVWGRGGALEGDLLEIAGLKELVSEAPPEIPKIDACVSTALPEIDASVSTACALVGAWGRFCRVRSSSPTGARTHFFAPGGCRSSRLWVVSHLLGGFFSSFMGAPCSFLMMLPNPPLFGWTFRSSTQSWGRMRLAKRRKEMAGKPIGGMVWRGAAAGRVETPTSRG